MVAGNRKVVNTTAWTAEKIDQAIAGRVRVNVGVNGGSGGSRQLIKGKTDRQPTLRGSQGEPPR